MKFRLYVSILAVVNTLAVTYAAGQAKQAQQGTIVNVQKQNVTSPSVRAGSDADRTPLQDHYYVYNVSVRLNCDVFVGRYESELDDLPSVLSANNSVPVRLQKHMMYLDLPGDPVKMRIVHHKVSDEATCAQSASAK